MEKLDQMHKILPWYEAVVLALNVLAWVLFREQATFGFTSLIPIFAMAFLILWCSILLMYREKNGKFEARRLKFSKLENRTYMESVPLFDTASHAELQPYVNPLQHLLLWEPVVFALAMPLPLFFVVFFSWQIKLTASLLLTLLPMIVCFVLDGMVERQDKLHRRQEKQRFEAELEKQKKREEQGYWK